MPAQRVPGEDVVEEDAAVRGMLDGAGSGMLAGRGMLAVRGMLAAAVRGMLVVISPRGEQPRCGGEGYRG